MTVLMPKTYLGPHQRFLQRINLPPSVTSKLAIHDLAPDPQQSRFIHEKKERLADVLYRVKYGIFDFEHPALFPHVQELNQEELAEDRKRLLVANRDVEFSYLGRSNSRLYPFSINHLSLEELSALEFLQNYLPEKDLNLLLSNHSVYKALKGVPVIRILLNMVYHLGRNDKNTEELDRMLRWLIKDTKKGDHYAHGVIVGWYLSLLHSNHAISSNIQLEAYMGVISYEGVDSRFSPIDKKSKLYFDWYDADSKTGHEIKFSTLPRKFMNSNSEIHPQNLNQIIKYRTWLEQNPDQNIHYHFVGLPKSHLFYACVREFLEMADQYYKETGLEDVYDRVQISLYLPWQFGIPYQTVNLNEAKQAYKKYIKEFLKIDKNIKRFKKKASTEYFRMFEFLENFSNSVRDPIRVEYLLGRREIENFYQDLQKYFGIILSNGPLKEFLLEEFSKIFELLGRVDQGIVKANFDILFLKLMHNVKDIFFVFKLNPDMNPLYSLLKVVYSTQELRFFLENIVSENYEKSLPMIDEAFPLKT